MVQKFCQMWVYSSIDRLLLQHFYPLLKVERNKCCYSPYSTVHECTACKFVGAQYQQIIKWYIQVLEHQEEGCLLKRPFWVFVHLNTGPREVFTGGSSSGLLAHLTSRLVVLVMSGDFIVATGVAKSQATSLLAEVLLPTSFLLLMLIFDCCVPSSLSPCNSVPGCLCSYFEATVTFKCAHHLTQIKYNFQLWLTLMWHSTGIWSFLVCIVVGDLQFMCLHLCVLTIFIHW